MAFTSKDQTRIVPSTMANYGPGRLVAQYYDRAMGVWFDIGEPVATEAEARQKIEEHTTRTYTVRVSNTFDAQSPHDAVRQMAAWLDDCAYQAGYRVEDEDGNSAFIDAERDLREDA